MSKKTIKIPASKSLSNRWLILQYLYPNLSIDNVSTADDTKVLQKALNKLKTATSSPIKINIGHAGTAMRFLTALLATLDGKEFILDGSTRMQQRPIGILVEALRQLGADIQYLKNDDYPPLHIKGKQLNGTSVNISQNVSSQYISALLLIAPKLHNGLKINLKGQQVSKPYVQMTLDILKELNIANEQNDSQIHILPKKNVRSKQISVEGDWSSASYFYGAAAVLQAKNISLSPFDKQSLQGDAKIAEYFKSFGIETSFDESQTIKLSLIKNFKQPDYLEFDLLDTPDLAQTLAVTCLVLGIKCRLTGLQTLRIKETDRLSALKTEMEKLGAEVKITDDSLTLTKPTVTCTNVHIDTFDDHRMAMSFAILQKKYSEIRINHPEVVSKSFPEFWERFSLV